jgi:hypothetical protein
MPASGSDSFPADFSSIRSHFVVHGFLNFKSGGLRPIQKHLKTLSLLPRPRFSCLIFNQGKSLDRRGFPP